MSTSTHLPEHSIQDIEYEEEYFNDYDQEMYQTLSRADEEDNYLYQSTEEYVMDERLLKLIVDVQSYLMDTPIPDSPLLPLQYKIYTFLKQHALSS
ncbi:hypothetical protein BY458DRAFT_265016 [Sporodiniella umbellata]|nr:hypothetical protein BY458DRAFT_265016 [Sporodiniella umbellata]